MLWNILSFYNQLRRLNPSKICKKLNGNWHNIIYPFLMSIKISLGTFNSSPVADSRGRVGHPHPKIVKIKYMRLCFMQILFDKFVNDDEISSRISDAHFIKHNEHSLQKGKEWHFEAVFIGSFFINIYNIFKI